MENWQEGGEQWMPLSPAQFPSSLIGKAAIHNQYKDLPQNFSSMQFHRGLHPTEDPNKVIVEYSGDIELAAGGRYDNVYAAIVETQDGKVRRFTEYFDPTVLTEAFGLDLQANFNVEGAPEKVSFLSEGLTLRGDLFLPAGFNPEESYAAVVVTGSWTTVKEQMPNAYAEQLAREGFVALTFDFRNYGESEGQPRNYEHPDMKAEDIVHAAEYLQSLPYVDQDRVGGLAICASAGYMALAETKGAPLNAIQFVAPWLHNAELVDLIYGGEEGVSAKLGAAEAAKDKFATTGEVEYVPAISTTNPNAAMYGEWDYYLNPERGAIPAWGNQFAVMAWKEWLTFDAVALAPQVKTPVQILHSQAAAVPAGTESFYAGLAGEKNIVWLENVGQFDFYDQDEYIAQGIQQASEWFEAQLK